MNCRQRKRRRPSGHDISVCVPLVRQAADGAATAENQPLICLSLDYGCEYQSLSAIQLEKDDIND